MGIPLRAKLQTFSSPLSPAQSLCGEGMCGNERERARETRDFIVERKGFGRDWVKKDRPDPL